MDLELSPDQELLGKTCVQFLRDRWPMERLRAVAEQREPLSSDYLADVAELGWYSMFVGEDHGGGSLSGDPACDAAIIAEVRGGMLAPGPFAAVNAAADLITQAGSARQRETLLPPLVEGTALATIPVGGDALSDGRAVTMTPAGQDLILSGSLVITDPSPAISHVIVAASGSGQAAVVPLNAPGVRRVPLSSLDLTRQVEKVLLDDVRVPWDGVLRTAPEVLEHARSVAVALSVAETVGALSQLFDMTRAYAMDRIAFGRPVASFQAVKHMLADMSLAVEQAKSVSVAAVRALDANRPYAPEVASIAKVFVAENAVRVAQDCLQLHGGIGFAWEHNLHLYLRRVAADAALFGSADWHRELILAAHRDELEPAYEHARP